MFESSHSDERGDVPWDPSSRWCFDLDTLAQEAQRYLHRTSPIGQINGIEIRYRISSGGQGSVFSGVIAGSSDPVAVKTLSQFAGADVLQRFEREIDIARALSHRNIVPILKSGLTKIGTPFFVMPQIKGVPLDQWASGKRARGEIRSILQLFVILCRTIHFAHQRGIIHRDLKPGNVLVSGDDQPNVLDFGLAKATQAEAKSINHNLSVTHDGHFLGSLPWTSPEQLERGARLVDVRTDVYAIGVMLYQSLTGEFPYTVEGALPAVVHGVMNTTPKPPSAGAKGISRDVDAIVLKSLEKDADARYQSADDFADDLKSYLDGEPNQARREQSRKLLQRHVRRYQAIVVISAVLIALSTGLYFRAAAARDHAESEAARATAVTDFLESLFGDLQPTRRGYDARVADLLDQAALELPERFADQPVVQAAVYYMLGNAYAGLGMMVPAGEYSNRALELRRAHLGDEHIDTARAAFTVASVSWGRSHDLYPLQQYVVDVFRKELGPEHPDTLQAEFKLLFVMPPDVNDHEILKQIDTMQARATSVNLDDARFGDRLLYERAHFELTIGKLADARRLIAALWERFASHPDPHYEFRNAAAHRLGCVHLLDEDLESATVLIREGLASAEAALGAHHPAAYLHHLVNIDLLILKGRLDEAEVELNSLEGNLDLSEPVSSVLAAITAIRRANFLSAVGQPHQAAAHLRRSIESITDATWTNSYFRECQRRALLTILLNAQEYDEAIELAEAIIGNGIDYAIADYEFARVQLEYGECLQHVG
ncbi:MAG: protein kinase, partial [Phycisphaerae bacterium]